MGQIEPHPGRREKGEKKGEKKMLTRTGQALGGEISCPLGGVLKGTQNRTRFTEEGKLYSEKKKKRRKEEIKRGNFC